MMNDTSWDWWFGDGPMKFRRRASMGFGSGISGWHRVSLRRRWLAAMAAGATLSLLGGALIVWADTPVYVAKAAFHMLDEQGNSDLPAPDSEDVRRRQRLRELLDQDKADEAKDSDEARRDRLKDLLKEGPRGGDRGIGDRGIGDRGIGNRDTRPDKREDVENGSKFERAPQAGTDGQFSEPFLKERLPDVAEGAFLLPTLQAVSTATSPIGNGKLPDDFAADRELDRVPLPEDAYSRGTMSPGILLPWRAPNTFSHPLYFEDRMLERHGHERWGCMQPIAAGARFFTTLPMLPYLATIQEPCDCVYSNGYYRAGSPAPLLYQRPPMDRRAVVVEAAVLSGAIIALP